MSRPARLAFGKFSTMTHYGQTVPIAVYPAVYEIRHLTEAQVDQAFPLVREIACSLSIGEWQRYASRMLTSERGLRREGGIIVAHQHGSIYIRGLCAYRLFPELFARDRLVTGCFAVPETIDCDSVARELIGACGSIAEAHGCRAVQVQLVDRNQWIEPLLRQAGYVVDHASYVWHLPNLNHI